MVINILKIKLPQNFKKNGGVFFTCSQKDPNIGSLTSGVCFA